MITADREYGMSAGLTPGKTGEDSINGGKTSPVTIMTTIIILQHRKIIRVLVAKIPGQVVQVLLVFLHQAIG